MIIKLKFAEDGSYLQHIGDATMIEMATEIRLLINGSILTHIRFAVNGKYYHQPVYAETGKWLDLDTELCDNYSVLELKEKKMKSRNEEINHILKSSEYDDVFVIMRNHKMASKVFKHLIEMANIDQIGSIINGTNTIVFKNGNMIKVIVGDSLDRLRGIKAKYAYVDENIQRSQGLINEYISVQFKYVITLKYTNEDKDMKKEKLKEQIEEMEAKLQEMRDELESSDKFEMKGGDWYVSGTGLVLNSSEAFLSNHYIDMIASFGMSRETEEQAQELRDFLRKTLIIKNYADQHNGDWKPDWSDFSQPKSCIYYDYRSKKWRYDTIWDVGMIDVVYMKKEVAESLCEKLNSGEVVL